MSDEMAKRLAAAEAREQALREALTSLLPFAHTRAAELSELAEEEGISDTERSYRKGDAEEARTAVEVACAALAQGVRMTEKITMSEIEELQEVLNRVAVEERKFCGYAPSSTEACDLFWAKASQLLAAARAGIAAPADALEEAARVVERSDIASWDELYSVASLIRAMKPAPVPFDPAKSPGHTDMMVPPETLDAFMEANPLPAAGVSVTAEIERVLRRYLAIRLLRLKGLEPLDEATIEGIPEAARAIASLPAAGGGGEDYFGALVTKARAAAAKASTKFPQPNYVTLKIAEEAGEVVRGAVHYAEGRMPWEEVEGEIVQLLAMLIRFVTEGDQINGITPPLTRPPAPERASAEKETP